MRIIELTRIVPDTLWAARFEGNDENEFDRTFNCWVDPEYLDEFFSAHEPDLVKNSQNPGSEFMLSDLTTTFL